MLLNFTSDLLRFQVSVEPINTPFFALCLSQVDRKLKLKRQEMTRFIPLLMAVALLCACGRHSAPQVDDPVSAQEEGIAVGNLQNVGMDEKVINRLTAQINGGVYSNLHSLLIMKDHKLVYEQYFTGDDEYWGQKKSNVRHSVSSLHDMRSISKSVVSACIGIALMEGKISSLDQRLFEFFPEYGYLNVHGKDQISLRNLLTMTCGLDWHEDLDYKNPENTEMQMIFSEDPVAFVLGRTVVGKPGEKWNYNGGATQLLAAVLQKATGQAIDDFANEHLFQPLGIKKYEWIDLPNAGIPAAASGLRLRSRDLLKFAILYSNKGKFNGQQILPEEWVEASLNTQVLRPDGRGGYGYQFWTWSDYVKNAKVDLAAASGNGGQRIYFDQENQLMVLTTAGNYNDAESERANYELVKDYIYPAVLEIMDSAER